MKPIAQAYFIKYGDKMNYPILYCTLTAEDILDFESYSLYVYYSYSSKERLTDKISIPSDFLRSKWYSYCEDKIDTRWIDYALNDFIIQLVKNEYRDDERYSESCVQFFEDGLKRDTITGYYQLMDDAKIDKKFIDIISEKLY